MKHKKNSRQKEVRAALSALSISIKPLVQSGMFGSVNEGLIAHYSNEGHFNLQTFKEWSKRGYSVNKGAKGLPVWGEQRTFNTRKGDSIEDENGKERKFYPICYLFSEQQVTKREVEVKEDVE